MLAGPYGNGVLVAILFNGRKSDALDLAYDPQTGQLSFSPPGVKSLSGTVRSSFPAFSYLAFSLLRKQYGRSASPFIEN